ncbi:hypothetical protein ACH4Y0_08125 [Streptomyces sp. NPDC020707]|uniref:hypothetical protein n=1 Tax=Streptomyces sp. NPDC020707 TaxID=3365084 RepID=UPI0037B9F551
MSDSVSAPALFTDEAAYVRAASSWRTGQPFPLLAGPELDRSARWLNEQAGENSDLPDIREQVLPGIVLSCGGAESGAVARLLATSTGRPLHQVDPADVLDVLGEAEAPYVALVGLAEEIEQVGDWMGTRHSGLGIVTARTASGLSTFVYRSLTEAFTMPAPTRRLVHPLMADSQDADVVGIDDIDVLRGERSGLLVLRTHGRECCVHLPDGIVCGRSDAPGPGVATSGRDRRVPACLEGFGCYRHDLKPKARVPAHELAGSVVFVHACDSLSPGFNSMPSSVNISLGLVDGTAIAVIGTIGRHRGDPFAEGVLERALQGGMTLGDAVRCLNARGETTGGELSRFGLLGDPARTFAPASATAQTSQDRRRNRGVSPATEVNSAHTETARRLATRVLPALERLRWMDVPVAWDDTKRLHAAVQGISDACLHAGHRDSEVVEELLDGVSKDLLETQTRVLEELATVAATTWWQYGGPAHSVYRQTEVTDAACPHCARKSARVVRYRHRICEDLEMTLGLCRRCGPWEWRSDAASLPVLHTAPMDVITGLGRPAKISTTLTNQQPYSIRGAAALCFVNGAYENLPEPIVNQVDIGPGGDLRLSYSVRPEARKVSPDIHEAMFLTLLDGRLTALPLWLDVRRNLPE